ncbi:hypothetical protein ACIGHC_12500 [Staphylococcus saprophyticus]|uniref:hypothetical protein n=1 Tax=Staphylococcus saprophyticus TaxID=29385 RepID=UPI00203F0934|nr:hypothetical protein [Staphylococcus saprophyticus]MCM3121479.1 hypothetical protein [Staphylococcus saprophyticus]
MDLKTSLKAGIDIIENNEVQKRYKFGLGKEDVDEAEDLLQALNMCGAEAMEDLYYDEQATYDVIYCDNEILFCISISELERFIHKLVIKEVFGTIKVSRKAVHSYITNGKCL